MDRILTLASNSPRRRQLLAFGGWTFDVRPVVIDETPLPGERPPDYVERIALAKAAGAFGVHAQGVNAAESLPPGCIAVAADTTVADGDDILGKPDGPEQAAAMLRRLRGRWHEVITAVAAVDAATGREAAEAVITRVQMRTYTDADIAAYVATGEPLDKAGAYGVQERGAALVAGISGSYSNVVGLPVDETRRLLEAFGVLTSARP